MLNAIHHVAIICSDYAIAKQFYHELLELPIIAEHYRAERDSWKLDLQLPDGSQLEVFSFPNAPARPSRPEAQGLRHLCFAVTDVAASVAWLHGKGIACEEIPHRPVYRARLHLLSRPRRPATGNLPAVVRR